MDPESLEDFKEQQAKVAKMQSAVTNGDFKIRVSSAFIYQCRTSNEIGNQLLRVVVRG